MNGIWKKTADYFSKLNQTTELQSKIVRLCNSGRFQEALQTMDLISIPPDSSIYSPILQLCIDSKAEKEGRLVHDHLLRNGFDSDLHLNTKLIIFYSKIGDVQVARSVFDKMSNRSVVSWTAMISGYCQNGYSKEVFEIFSEMHRSGGKANQFTFGSVLKACTRNMLFESGKQIQGYITKSRFSENVFVKSALVDLHSKCGKMEDARCLFEEMSERDVVSWNVMIGGYAVQGLPDNSFAMFRLMLNDGLVPDQFSIGSVLKGFHDGRSLRMINLIHGFIIHLGFQPHGTVIGALIDTYAKCGSVRSARLIYDFMEEKDLFSCTALITGYAREGSHSREALDLFSEIWQMSKAIDDVIMCSMLNICANIASLSTGRQIHALALKNHPNFDIAMGNALIDMYAKSGELEDANRVFDKMQQKNVISWTSLITGYGKHGYGEKALALLKKMEDNGLKPNDITFLSALFACSHTGMTIEGQECFRSMINEYNIKPRAEHYSCMVDLYARAGQLEYAYEWISKMEAKPNASLWGAILGSCKNHGSLSLGKVAAEHLFDLVPENSANYVTLASMYSEAGLWEEATKTRKLMEGRSVKKDPGCSLIHTG